MKNRLKLMALLLLAGVFGSSCFLIASADLPASELLPTSGGQDVRVQLQKLRDQVESLTKEQAEKELPRPQAAT